MGVALQPAHLVFEVRFERAQRSVLGHDRVFLARDLVHSLCHRLAPAFVSLKRVVRGRDRRRELLHAGFQLLGVFFSGRQRLQELRLLPHKELLLFLEPRGVVPLEVVDGGLERGFL